MMTARPKAKDARPPKIQLLHAPNTRAKAELMPEPMRESHKRPLRERYEKGLRPATNR